MEKTSGNLKSRKRLTDAGSHFERDFSVKILTRGILSFTTQNAFSPSTSRSIKPTPNILKLEKAKSLILDEILNHKDSEHEEEIIVRDSSMFDVDFKFNLGEYCADQNDLDFLTILEFSGQSLTQNALEMAMDRFEKIAAFNFWKTGASVIYSPKPPIVNGFCDVCGGNDEARNNRLVICYICHMAVHQECYGLPYYPLSKWKCRRCGINPSSPLKCKLCPIEGGAMKFSSTNQPIHQLCAIWINGVIISQNSFLEPIDIKEVFRNVSTCNLCKKNYGAVVGCANDDCEQKMHVTCAAIAGVIMETAIIMRGGRKFIRRVYCPKHSKMDKAQIKRGIDRVTKALNKRMPIDIRVRPIDKAFISPNFINTKLTQEEIFLIYNYWLIKRLRNYGSSMVPRVQALVDRLAKPIRHLQNEHQKSLQQAYKNRVLLKPSVHGELNLIGKFTTDFPILSDNIISYFENSLNNPNNDAALDYPNKKLILHKQQIHLDSIPVIDKNVELLFCRKKEDVLRVVVDLIREYVDPTFEFDLSSPYSPIDEISPWDIIGLIFYIAVPEHVQITAFICSLWLLDPLKMFENFDKNSKNPLNLKIITKKALHKEYSTLKQVYRDFHKMMQKFNSLLLHFQGFRKKYIERYEEAVSYSMIPRRYVYALQTLINEIKVDGNKMEMFLKYLMHDLTQNENNNEISISMEDDCLEKLRISAHYARSLIRAEKVEPLPNMDLLKRLYQRRVQRGDDEPSIDLPTSGYSIMLGFRIPEILEKVYYGRCLFPIISWSESHKQIQKRDKKLDVKIKKFNGISKLVQFKKSPQKRKRRIPVEKPSRPVKIKKEGEKKKYISAITDDQIRPPPPRRPKNPKAKFDPINHKQIKNELTTTEDENSNVLNPPQISPTFHHDALVIVTNSSKGKKIAGKIIDPRIYERSNSTLFQKIMSLPNATKKSKYICVKLFLNENITEWISKTKIKVLNIIEVENYVKNNSHNLSFNQSSSIQSFNSAYKYYTENLCM